ncbi:MAG: ParB/RepB/Spo0J family partition protein [Clostridia bacterium]|nr:ParB/RepB/Spo0J family partition protein [Clostridia bacterium]
MKRGLGRGLNSLFGDYEEVDVNAKNTAVEPKVEIKEIVKEVVVNEPKEIDIGLIDRNPDQPRKQFDEDALNELANSIKTHGVIQPIIVQEKDGRYIIIAGERRWRASRIAGLKTIPCVIKDYTKQEISEIAIVENLQREDLNVIEAARAIKNLIENYNLTQDEVADKIGKSRPAIANTLRLLQLPDQILTLVEQDKLSAGHARALLAVDNPVKQKELALQVIERNLNVRDIENLIRNLNKEVQAKVVKQEKSLELKDFEEKLTKLFSTKVEIKGTDKKGKIIIDYYTLDDIQRIFEIINK